MPPMPRWPPMQRWRSNSLHCHGQSGFDCVFPLAIYILINEASSPVCFWQVTCVCTCLSPWSNSYVILNKPNYCIFLRRLKSESLYMLGVMFFFKFPSFKFTASSRFIRFFFFFFPSSSSSYPALKSPNLRTSYFLFFSLSVSLSKVFG